MTDKITDKAILDAVLKVPAHLVPLEALEMFKASIKDKEGNEINYTFYSYDYTTNMYHFARGNMELIRRVFGHLQIDDRRVIAPMACSSVSTPQGYGIQFSGSLRPSQMDVVKQVIDGDGYGQLSAAPRFGKTVTMTYLTCAWGSKTLFLSHEISLAKQALMTFYKYSNVIDVEYQLGYPVIGLVEEWDDLDKYDVCFMTYQKFRDGKDHEAQLVKYAQRFGTVFIDESHKGSADTFSPVIANFNARRRIGVSGTVIRKDKKHIIGEFNIGPVVAEGKTEQIPCSVAIMHTGITVPYQLRGNMNFFFTQMRRFLSSDDARNDAIAKLMAGYADAGHFCIAVTETTAHCEHLEMLLKTRHGIVAEAYHAKKFKKPVDREHCLNRVRKGETQCLIAIRSMVLGLDLPRLTAFFNLMPTSNGPSYYQEYCRVRTPFESKRTAYIIDFVDSHRINEATLKTRRKLYEGEGFDIEEHKLNLK